MAPSPFSTPVKCYRITTFSPLFSSLKCNFCNISLPRKLPRNVNQYGSSPSPFSCQYSVYRNLYSQRQTGMSLITFDAKNSESRARDDQVLDAVLKLYFAIINRNTPQLSEILPDESQGKKQVFRFFSSLIKIFGNNVQIVVKQTLQDGVNVGVQWKFESEKIHVPLGNGFSFHICHSYKGKAVIRNIETFMEPLLQILPFRLKIMASLAGLKVGIGSFMELGSENKAKRIPCIVLALLSLAALLFFLRLAS